MPSVRKFLFDESFDVDLPNRNSYYVEEEELLPEPEPEPPPEPEPEPEPEVPPPPTFSEEELAAARSEGYAEGERAGQGAGYGRGFAEGLNAGKTEGIETGRTQMAASSEARLANALERIANGVGQLLADRQATNAMRQDQPVHIALAIVRKLMPELARRGGLDEIEGLVRSCLTELLDEPRLVVRVAPDIVEAVRERMDALGAQSGFGARMMVIAEAGLEPGDCRIEWAEGGVERDTRRLMADIEHCMAQLLQAPAPQ